MRDHPADSAFWGYSEDDRPDDDLTCLDGPEGCAGPVEYRTTPDRSDGRAFLRCEAHFDRRMESVERTLELTSDVPPAWFDPGYAGESWDEG